MVRNARHADHGRERGDIVARLFWKRPAGLRQEQGGAELKRTERVRGVEKGGLAPRPEHRASMTAAMTARLSPGKWPEMVSALRGRAALEPLRFRWKHILRFGDSWRIRRE